MIDFLARSRTMPFTGPEDRALLGSNPSAAAGDGNQRRRTSAYDLLRRPLIQRLVLVPNAINPLPFVTLQPGPKPGPRTQPVCHMAISKGGEPRSGTRGPKRRGWELGVGCWGKNPGTGAG
jgi:hypothetical protein